MLKLAQSQKSRLKDFAEARSPDQFKTAPPSNTASIIVIFASCLAEHIIVIVMTIINNDNNHIKTQVLGV